MHLVIDDEIDNTLRQPMGITHAAFVDKKAALEQLEAGAYQRLAHATDGISVQVICKVGESSTLCVQLAGRGRDFAESLAERVIIRADQIRFAEEQMGEGDADGGPEMRTVTRAVRMPTVEQQAAGFKHPPKFSERSFRITQMLEHGRVNNDIAGVRRKRDTTIVRDRQEHDFEAVQVSVFGGALNRQLNVNPDDQARALSGVEDGFAAPAAAVIEDYFAAEIVPAGELFVDYAA